MIAKRNEINEAKGPTAGIKIRKIPSTAVLPSERSAQKGCTAEKCPSVRSAGQERAYGFGDDVQGKGFGEEAARSQFQQLGLGVLAGPTTHETARNVGIEIP